MLPFLDPARLEANRPGLIRHVGLDELRQKSERFLPAEAAGLGWDDSRHAFLHDVQLGSARDGFQSNRRVHLAGKIRIVERVRVVNAFMWHEVEIFAAEGVTATRSEIRE